MLRRVVKRESYIQQVPLTSEFDGAMAGALGDARWAAGFRIRQEQRLDAP